MQYSSFQRTLPHFNISTRTNRHACDFFFSHCFKFGVPCVAANNLSNRYGWKHRGNPNLLHQFTIYLVAPLTEAGCKFGGSVWCFRYPVKLLEGVRSSLGLFSTLQKRHFISLSTCVHHIIGYYYIICSYGCSLTHVHEKLNCPYRLYILTNDCTSEFKQQTQHNNTWF